MSLARRLLLAALALALLATASGCFLPMGTAAPQSAKTVGRGGYATSFHAELPTINLIAEDQDEQGQDGDQLVVAPSASMHFGVQFGLTDRLDLELGVEGALYLFLLPIPTGASGGFRYQIVQGGPLDLAIAARGGYVGISGDDGDQPSDGDWSASAKFGSFSLVGQLADGPVRPLAAVNLMPAFIDQDLPDQAPESFTGIASSLTIGVAFVAGHFQLTPFATLAYFGSTEIDGAGTFSFGVSIAARPTKRLPVAAPPPMLIR
jgi:hypothetical protein